LLDPQKTLIRLLSAAGIDNYMEVMAQPKPPSPDDQMKMALMQKQIEKLQSEIDFNSSRAAAKLSEAHTQGIKAYAQADAQQFKAAHEAIHKEDIAPHHMTNQ
jgi:hypothetical protein